MQPISPFRKPVPRTPSIEDDEFEHLLKQVEKNLPEIGKYLRENIDEGSEVPKHIQVTKLMVLAEQTRSEHIETARKVREWRDKQLARAKKARIEQQHEYNVTLVDEPTEATTEEDIEHAKWNETYERVRKWSRATFPEMERVAKEYDEMTAEKENEETEQVKKAGEKPRSGEWERFSEAPFDMVKAGEELDEDMAKSKAAEQLRDEYISQLTFAETQIHRDTSKRV